jgi:hypothetical protein
MMVTIGCWFNPEGVFMLEARKLSVQVQQDQAGKMWSWLSGLVWLTTLAVLASVWIGANFEAPPPDKSQEKMSAAHAQAVSVVANLNQMLAPEQELTPQLFEQLAALSAPLAGFGQMAAVGLRISPDSQDTQTWPGKINAMVGDLKIVSDGQESLANHDRLRDALWGMYKPKGPLNPKLLAEGSASRGFYMATLDWVNLTLPSASTPAASPSTTAAPVLAVGVVPKLTWAAHAKGQPLVREINVQLDALELEAKQAEDPARVKLAKETLALLEKNEGLQTLRKADEAWSKIVASQDRLKTLVGQLPPEPQVVLSAPSWHWSRLAYPGTSSQGMVAVVFMLLLGMAFNAAGYIARRNHLRALSQRWLAVTQQLEAAVRTVDAPLANSVQRMDALSLEFGPILDKLKQMQQALSTPSESPPKTMEAQAWNVALRMQSELESDLNLLREKLLNIHLQFCSGQTHENLVYDLAFTTEAVQTVSVTAKDLGRSVALLKDSLQQAEDVGDGQEIESLTAQVSSLRASAKRIALSLQELSDRLQVAVEDVPKGRRFEAERAGNETGRPSVNQSI